MCHLTYPGLIMGLCKNARVQIHAEGHQTIEVIINDNFIERLCVPRDAAPPTTPAQQPFDLACIPVEFLAYANWPEDKPVQQEGAVVEEEVGNDDSSSGETIGEEGESDEDESMSG
ncbi:unnamed protein product [Vicia faba]|uniref:Galectin n=1 Tax=Vicia faba TaxID=3906 RepID=A0AAV1AHH7_VICFA|nr:unnamed protein product [Vicia faba]